MTYVADVSFGWPTVTGAVLKSLGCSGVIGYAGCADTAKNVSKARFQDWIETGLKTSLVIENGDTDMANPANGVPQGKAILAAATDLGYDVDSCVLYASADFNVPPASKTLAAVDECMAQFATVVPVAGLYGNSYAIDYSWQSGSAVKWWQSDSTSYSNGLSSHAHLQQIYNDPRAKGQPIDISNVIRTPLAFMGEAPPTARSNSMNFRVMKDPRSTNIWAIGDTWRVLVGTSGVPVAGVLAVWLSLPDCLSTGVEVPDATHWDQYQRRIMLTQATAGLSLGDALTATLTTALLPEETQLTSLVGEVGAIAVPTAAEIAAEIVPLLPAGAGLTAQQVQDACAAALANATETTTFSKGTT